MAERRKRFGGGAGKDDKDVRISKKLAFILRHGAEKEGIAIGSDGYVKLDDLLSRPDFKEITFEKIKDVVENNDKKRFEMTKNDLGQWQIRAAQGHTIKTIDDEELLKKVTLEQAATFETVVHGTKRPAWELIKTTGLNKMDRNHIHFAVGYPGEEGVISGMRGSCQIFIEINILEAVKDGIPFYLSTNNVLLSPGIAGVLSPKYFQVVKDNTGKILMGAEKIKGLGEEKKKEADEIIKHKENPDEEEQKHRDEEEEKK